MTEKTKNMIDLDDYLEKLLTGCRSVFGDRFLYAGLQGSYMRNEAGEDSDIDVMIILEAFAVRDLDAYREILEAAGHSDKACGFICGRKEMETWNPLEICHLLHTTKDLYGRLSDYVPEASREDEVNYIKISLGNLYHELCHRYIHADREKNAAKFRGTCKGLFFLIQNMHYLESGTFAVTKAELKKLVSEEDRTVLSMAELPDDYDFDEAFACVFRWCQDAFARMDETV